MRNAFRDGDVWFNSGDLMRSQGFGHATFTDRLGDTFRWKGENVATTEVEAALSSDPQVEECTVFGVEVKGTGGRAGMAAIQLKKGEEFDGKALATAAYERLPGYAVPLFVRVVGELAHTSTFKSQKVDLREQGYSARSTPSTCWPVVTRAMCRSTTSTPPRSRQASAPDSDLCAIASGERS